MSAMSEQFEKDFAVCIPYDAKFVTVVGPDSIPFEALCTVIQNDVQLADGGVVQGFVMSLSVPKYTADLDGVMTEQFQDGIPAEGEICLVNGWGRRIVSIEESPDGAGWVFTLIGPDED